MLLVVARPCLCTRLLTWEGSPSRHKNILVLEKLQNSAMVSSWLNASEGEIGTVWAVFTTRDGAWLMVCMHLCLLTTMTTSVEMVVVGSWLHKTMLGLIR